ncbi:hypothetical protein T484DRAFT_1610332 [Baffinella frigidus]|nr:hypothetical protein T484DRAFT_1610332 [Cryptophyta sp. CCMP2293]
MRCSRGRCWCARNPKPEARNVKRETRNAKREIRNPEPGTRNPKPETRNPKPETRDPEASRTMGYPTRRPPDINTQPEPPTPTRQDPHHQASTLNRRCGMGRRMQSMLSLSLCPSLSLSLPLPLSLSLSLSLSLWQGDASAKRYGISNTPSTIHQHSTLTPKPQTPNPKP